MILWEKSDCSPDWTELLSILADLAKLTEKCSKNCGLLPVTEPDQTEPTEITELTRPNLRELPYVPGRTYGKCRYIDTEI